MSKAPVIDTTLLNEDIRCTIRGPDGTCCLAAFPGDTKTRDWIESKRVNPLKETVTQPYELQWSSFGILKFMETDEYGSVWIEKPRKKQIIFKLCLLTEEHVDVIKARVEKKHKIRITRDQIQPMRLSGFQASITIITDNLKRVFYGYVKNMDAIRPMHCVFEFMTEVDMQLVLDEIYSEDGITMSCTMSFGGVLFERAGITVLKQRLTESKLSDAAFGAANPDFALFTSSQLDELSQMIVNTINIPELNAAGGNLNDMKPLVINMLQAQPMDIVVDSKEALAKMSPINNEASSLLARLIQAGCLSPIPQGGEAGSLGGSGTLPAAGTPGAPGNVSTPNNSSASAGNAAGATSSLTQSLDAANIKSLNITATPTKIVTSNNMSGASLAALPKSTQQPRHGSASKMAKEEAVAEAKYGLGGAMGGGHDMKMVNMGYSPPVPNSRWYGNSSESSNNSMTSSQLMNRSNNNMGNNDSGEGGPTGMVRFYKVFRLRATENMTIQWYRLNTPQINLFPQVEIESRKDICKFSTQLDESYTWREVPGPATNLSVIRLAHSAWVHFTPPVHSGSTPIEYYTVDAKPIGTGGVGSNNGGASNISTAMVVSGNSAAMNNLANSRDRDASESKTNLSHMSGIGGEEEPISASGVSSPILIQNLNPNVRYRFKVECFNATASSRSDAAYATLDNESFAQVPLYGIIGYSGPKDKIPFNYRLLDGSEQGVPNLYTSFTMKMDVGDASPAAVANQKAVAAGGSMDLSATNSNPKWFGLCYIQRIA